MLGIVVLVAICLTGCGNLVQEENSTEEPLVSYDFGEYSKIGISFSEILRNSSIVDINSRQVSLADNNSESNTCVELDEFYSVVPYLLKNNYITDEGAIYIEEIENYLYTSEDSLSDILNNISQIEEKALLNLSGAAAGAIVVGSSSGKAGYDKESICVDVPLKF